MLGFGSAHSECKVTVQARVFQVDEPIVGVASFIPPLAPGSKSTVRLEHDGTELGDFGATITATEPSPCLWVDLSGLEPGRYRLEVAVAPSAMPPMRGEFEVTSSSAGASSSAPAASASTATSPEASQTPEPAETREPTPSPEPTPEPVYQALQEVEVGDCYISIDDADDGATLAVQLVDCSEPHTSEAFLVEQLEGGAGAPFPGLKEIERQVYDLCDPAFETYVGIPYDRSRLEYIYFGPDEESWASRDRIAMCVIEEKGQIGEGSAKGSGQ